MIRTLSRVCPVSNSLLTGCRDASKNQHLQHDTIKHVCTSHIYIVMHVGITPWPRFPANTCFFFILILSHYTRTHNLSLTHPNTPCSLKIVNTTNRTVPVETCWPVLCPTLIDCLSPQEPRAAEGGWEPSALNRVRSQGSDFDAQAQLGACSLAVPRWSRTTDLVFGISFGRLRRPQYNSTVKFVTISSFSFVSRWNESD